MGKGFFILLTVILLAGCQPSPPALWHLMLHHNSAGEVQSGSPENIVNAVRRGCQLRIAWGARRAADPSQTIEHIAEPVWVAVRNGTQVEVQLDDFLINHAVLGEPEEDHPRRARFGGTSKAVMWRAQLKPDGSFDAVWYSPQTGELITRIPQQHELRWFSDCPPGEAAPLYPDISGP